MDTETTLTAQERDGRMTVEDPNGSRWWPTNEGQLVIDSADDPKAEAVRLAASHDSTMGVWYQ